MTDLFVLYESASGYALLKTQSTDEVGGSDALKAAIEDLARFSKVASLTAFKPFSSAADALENINAVSEGEVTEGLQDFLELSLPKLKAKDGKKAKKSGFSLGVLDPKLGSAIQDATGIPCEAGEYVREMMRGVRLHFSHFVDALREDDLKRASLGLAHSYSRAKVKFNVNRSDNMIIQAIALQDTLDKDVNTFVMRVREWYGWHFPELQKVVSDNYAYARTAMFIKDKSNVQDEMVPELAEIVGSEEVAKEVLEAARASMGQDISPIDRVNIEAFAARVISLAEYRQKLGTYLVDKMNTVAPNLSALIGETVGARLISHAGSLTNLAKYPASTVQILGAEKALFRALKTKGNTPKYGLIYHSSFIGRAQAKNKGRISRYLANKCSIASRIDCFTEGEATNVFGEKLKEQVEERLAFYDKGAAPRKNIDVMKEAIKASGGTLNEDKEAPKSSKKESKKRKSEAADVDMAEATPEKKSKKEKAPKSEKKAKSEKKEKKSKKDKK